jgi:hypothetical protein
LHIATQSAILAAGSALLPNPKTPQFRHCEPQAKQSIGGSWIASLRSQ